jgi:hypothetical protein
LKEILFVNLNARNLKDSIVSTFIPLVELTYAEYQRKIQREIETGAMQVIRDRLELICVSDDFLDMAA